MAESFSIKGKSNQKAVYTEMVENRPDGKAKERFKRPAYTKRGKITHRESGSGISSKGNRNSLKSYFIQNRKKYKW